MGCIERQLEGLYEHRSSRECPLAGGREANFFFRNRDPALLAGAVGPEGHHEVIRNQAVARYQVASVLEHAGLGEQRRYLAVRGLRHEQVGSGYYPCWNGSSGDARHGCGGKQDNGAQPDRRAFG